MVRIKHRYLLFNILYPTTSSTSPPDESSEQPSYLQFSRPSPSSLTPALIASLLRTEIQSLFGDHGLSVTQSSLRIIYFSPATSTGILRVPRAHFRLVWAALSFVTAVPGEKARGVASGGRRDEGKPAPCVVQVVRVSGTIRKSEEELLRRARRDVVRAKMEQSAAGDDLLGMFAGEHGKKRTTNAMNKIGGLDDTEQGIIDLDDEEEDEDMDDLSD